MLHLFSFQPFYPLALVHTFFCLINSFYVTITSSLCLAFPRLCDIYSSTQLVNHWAFILFCIHQDCPPTLRDMIPLIGFLLQTAASPKVRFSPKFWWWLLAHTDNLTITPIRFPWGADGSWFFIWYWLVKCQTLMWVRPEFSFQHRNLCGLKVLAHLLLTQQTPVKGESWTEPKFH